jgi:hypothetical protein
MILEIAVCLGGVVEVLAVVLWLTFWGGDEVTGWGWRSRSFR